MEDVNHTRVLWALLFMTGAMYGIDIFSAVNSSPWTAESFGGNPEKEASLKKYITHAALGSLSAGVIAMVIARSAWPLIGASGATGYMLYLYNEAIESGKAKGSEGWG